MDDPSDSEPGRECPWCSARADAAATRCPSCGAALAQRESIAGLVIPGVTAVDPALQAFDAQPHRIPGASPSQGLAGTAITAAALGAPLGIGPVLGLGVIAAAEYLGATASGADQQVDLATLGQPSGAALQAVERLEREGEAPTTSTEAGAEGPGAKVEPGDPGPNDT